MKQKSTAKKQPTGKANRKRLALAPPKPEPPTYYTPNPSNLPLGIRLEDCAAMEACEGLEGYNVFEGDKVLCVKTRDIQSGDLVWWRKAGRETAEHVSRFYTAPGGRVRLEQKFNSDKGYANIYKSEAIEILGRVFCVERGRGKAPKIRPLQFERAAAKRKGGQG